MESLVVAFVGLLSSILTGLVSWKQARSSQEATILSLQQEVGRLREQNLKTSNKLGEATASLSQAQPLAEKYAKVRERLQSSSVVHRHLQPVILLGPRAVGKTSLLMQWHAPWNHSQLSATSHHRVVEVPVFDAQGREVEPHFADHDIRVAVDRHMVLSVHDFPGESHLQKKVKEIALRETQTLRHQTGKSLGLVLICMFNAEEAELGISRETQAYYNGELFQELRGLVTFHQVAIERLILVFNKYDLLRSRVGRDVSDQALLKKCLDRFDSTFSLLAGACHPDRVCECFTVLGREELMHKSQGASLVLGEAARNFVATVLGPEAVREIVKAEATRFASSRF